MGAEERKRLRKIRTNVIIRDGYFCCYCEVPLTEETVTMEHIVPDSKKGTYNTTNLTVSCSACNNRRGNKPFFDYCKQYNFSEEKINKYKKLYFNNLKIKILNIAKEECLRDSVDVPNELIAGACSILRIKLVDFSDYQDQLEIGLSDLVERRRIKYNFEQLIKRIESEV